MKIATLCVTRQGLLYKGTLKLRVSTLRRHLLPFAHLESIRLLLSISCVHKFKLHQMDVKSVFINGFLQEEVFVEQPKGFVDAHHPNHIYRLKNALYGLK